MLGSDSKILSNLSIDIGNKSLAPNDKDEMCHNSFYYAIRSNNVVLLETLINKWPRNYFSSNSEDLDQILSAAYEELKLKNVQLQNKMELFVESKLLNLRFFSDPSKKTVNIKDEYNTKERIQLVLENMALLSSDYCAKCKVINEKFLYIGKFVAQNIHILKQLLKSTYDKLPWEEIEFCLISFISAHLKQENYLYTHAILNKDKILKYLSLFKIQLEKHTRNIDIFKPNDVSRLKREQVIEKIIDTEPEFQYLYYDFQQLRDIQSLQIINKYLQLALSVDPTKREGQLILTRVLQVIGEYLKNTLESPNLSSSTSELLLLTLQKNSKEIIIDLRNSLSHAYSLDKRNEIETNTVNFFINIQNDTKKIGGLVIDILLKAKMKIIRELLKKCIETEDVVAFKELSKIISCAKMNDLSISESFNTAEHEKLEVLVKNLNESVKVKTGDEQKLLSKINDIVDKGKKKSKSMTTNYFLGIGTLKAIGIYLNDSLVDKSVIRDIKWRAKQSLEYIRPKTESSSIKEIVELAIEFHKAVSIRSVLFQTVGNENEFLDKALQSSLDDSLKFSSLVKHQMETESKTRNKLEEIKRIVFEMFHIAQFGMSNLKWIEELKRKLSKISTNSLPSVKQSTSTTEEKYFKQLTAKLSELKNILSPTATSTQLAEKVNYYRKNKKMQAVVEMLVLDIMSILGASKKYLENNLLYLDNSAPVLTGKSLRNHLAHYNALVDILSSDSSISIMLNAQKIIAENMQNKRFGKSAAADISKLKYKFNQGLDIYVNQEKMFLTLEEGDIEALKVCLRNGCDIKAQNMNSWTALHFAAKGSSIETAKYVLKQNLDIQARDDNGRNPLHIAAEYGRTSLIDYFIQVGGVSVNDTDNWHKTPLHIAAQSGHIETVKYLLGKKVDCAAHDKSGLSALHYAIRNGFENIAKVLLERESNVDHNEALGGFTPLHEAAAKGYLDLVIFLIEKGANINAKNDRHWTPLFAASYNGHLEVVCYLIRKGAEVNAKVIDNCTPLHYAVQGGNIKVVDVLLKHRAEVEVMHSTLYNTPLHYAAIDGHVDIAQLLLEHSANSKAVTSNSLASIHIAAQCGHLKLVSLLLQHGVDVNTKDKNKNTPLHYASRMGHTSVVDFLLKNKALDNERNVDGSTPLHLASMQGYEEVVDVLIKNGAEVNVNNKKGMTPLHLAVAEGKINVANLLVKRKANVNIKAIGGITPLCLAAQNGHKDLAALLLKHKAEVNPEEMCASTPLHAAASEGHISIVKLLLKNNVRVDLKDNLGITSLQIAIRKGHKEIVDILIKNGALSIINKDDFTELLVSAVMENNKDIVLSLLANKICINWEVRDALALAIIAGHRDIVNIFLEHKVKVNHKFPEYTFLHLAASWNHKEIVEDLIANKAFVDSVIKDTTPLFLAAKNGHAGVVKILIENGADVNFVLKSMMGLTPLCAAVMFGHNSVVKVLLDNNADIMARDTHDHRTPYETAVYMGHLDIFKTMLESKKISVNIKGYEKFSLLHIAVEGKRLPMIKYLIEEGADINASNFNDAKPIHIAARESTKEILEFLISKGCKISDTGFYGQTVLHYATSLGQLENVKFLIEKGVDVNLADRNGFTPLHIAAGMGHKGVVQVLLNNGAIYNAVDGVTKKQPRDIADDIDIINALSCTNELFQAIKHNKILNVKMCIINGAAINAKNTENGTPLHFAAWKGYHEVVKVLLEYQSNPNIVGRNGFMPLHYAAKYSHLRIVKDLLCSGAIYNACSASGKTPLDLAVNSDVIALLKFVSNAFKNVQMCNPKVIRDLNKVQDVATAKAILNTCNKENKTLVVLATLCNFPLVEDLKEVLYGDIGKEISRAIILFNQNDYQKAMNIFKSVLEKRKEILGPNSPGTLDIESYISKILYKQGFYKEALNINQEMLRKQNKIFGVNHQCTLSTRSTIALILHRQGENEALDIFREVYKLQNELLGPNHNDTLETQLYMAIALDGHGEYDEALYHNQEVYKQREKENHPGALLAQNNIAMVLGNQEKIDEALKILKEVLSKKTKVFGNTHCDTLRTRQHIAGLLFKQKKYPEALKAHEELLSIQKIVLGTNHPDTQNTHYNLAHVLFTQSKCVAALKIYKEILHQRKATWGPNHPTVLEVVNRIKVINLHYQFEGGNISEMCQQLQNTLYVAVNDGDLEAVQKVLQNGVNINERDSDGRTLLHYACNNGQTNIVKYLLKNRADAIIATNKGNTPLHTATSKGHKDTVKVLLTCVSREELNGFINTQTTIGGNTALHVAAKNGFIDITLYLLDAGAIYNLRDKEGKTPLKVAEIGKVSELLQLVQELFECVTNADTGIKMKLKSVERQLLPVLVNARDNFGKTMLQVAISKKYKNIIDILLNVIKNSSHD